MKEKPIVEEPIVEEIKEWKDMPEGARKCFIDGFRKQIQEDNK